MSKQMSAAEELKQAVQPVGNPGTMNGGNRQYPLWLLSVSTILERKQNDNH